jgi:phage/plasmid-like protein (TIGR03299 family)
VVGKKYKVVQNVEAFEFFDAIVGEGDAIYETAGALGNGETVFITAKLPGHIRVPDEEIEKYIMLKLTHDGSGAIIGGFTPVRVVCNNTLSWAMGHQGRKLGERVSIRHTASANEKLREAHKLMGIANKLTEDLGEVFTYMKKQPIIDKDVQELFQTLILTKDEIAGDESDISTQKQNTLLDMWEFYNVGIGQENIKGTKFGAYNAVSGYYQNAKASSNPEGLLKSNLFGHNADVVKKAMSILVNV